jgi:hypothetical protein
LLINLKNHTKNNGQFSITFDTWTSKSQTAYLGTILIYINTDFELQYKLIGFQELNESHTGLFLYNIFTDILNLYIPYLDYRNITSITRDNASNNDKCIEILKRFNRDKTIYNI